MSGKGVDYSHYQGTPNVQKMMDDGVEFVIIKAWEGDHPDPNFTENLENAIDAHMPVMAYVYLHSSDTDARRQACFDHIGETVLCLDWEAEGVQAHVVEAWMDAYEAVYNRRGMVYYGSYPPDAPTPRIGEWPRWFPHYANKPALPPWDGITPNPDWRDCYAIWQSSSTGKVDGISGLVDTDELAPYLSIGELIAWINESRPPRPDVDLVEPAIRCLQLALNVAGYNAGTVDGLWGPHTQQAIDDYSGWNE